MPVVGGELAGDQGGAALEAVIQEFEEDALLGFVKRFEPPIVQDEQLDFGQLLQAGEVTPVASGKSELLQQAAHTKVTRAVAMADSLVGEGAGQVGLAGAGGAGQH